ncbi:MAG TPA: helix-turn-helix transcriptional regulator [Alphaproteobacteria bacterium]|nr:helix-turn-helix transcriptional regulator [Alphaproteobacteria bacterium]
MLKHADIWRAIDTLAGQHGLTASGLARKAGLDPTTFNKSKRVTASGRCRWPSTESVAKALEAVDATLDDFVGFVQENGSGRVPHAIPVATESKAAVPSAYDESGGPYGNTWDHMAFPGMRDLDAYAIAIEGDEYHPVLRDGALVVAAPHADLRAGDRVLVRLASAKFIFGELVRRTDDQIEIGGLCGDDENRTLMADEVAAVHRIVWAEQ